MIVNNNTHAFSTKWPVFMDKLDKNFPFSIKWCIFMDKAIKNNERYLLLCHAERSEASLQ